MALHSCLQLPLPWLEPTILARLYYSPTEGIVVREDYKKIAGTLSGRTTHQPTLLTASCSECQNIPNLAALCFPSNSLYNIVCPA